MPLEPPLPLPLLSPRMQHNCGPELNHFDSSEKKVTHSLKHMHVLGNPLVGDDVIHRVSQVPPGISRVLHN